MEEETNSMLYDIFHEIDLNSNTSINLSNEESIEKIALDDYEVCIDDIDVNISLDTIPEIVFVAEELMSKLTVMVNKFAGDKIKEKKYLNVRNVAKVIKHSRISTSIQQHVAIKFSQIKIKL